MVKARVAKIVTGVVLAAALAVALPLVAQTQLSGGAVTVSVPAGETTPAFSFTNKTGVPICDLVITRGAGGFNINGGVVDDPQHSDEDWDVDDNEDGTLSTGAGGESTAPPGGGAGGEGAGGGATGHADNQDGTPGGKLRVQENGADADNESKCVGANRNFQVTVSLSAAAGEGDTLKIQPTNVRDANLVAFADGLLGHNEVWALAADTTINSSFAAFGTDRGTLSSLSFQVMDPDVLLVELETVPRGIVDLASGTVFFNPPLDTRQGLRVFGVLTGPATVVVSAEGVREVRPKPVDAEPIH